MSRYKISRQISCRYFCE